MNKIRANQIATQALKVRKIFLNASANSPICPYNLAENMELDLRFVKISSFEGMYLPEDKVILISAERPEGRKRFTCAHEIGHHVLKHGTVIDEIVEYGSNKEIEKEADFFASMLLMPASLVKLTSNTISCSFDQPDAAKVYQMSRYIGVSYLALIAQLHFNLNLISEESYQNLKRENIASIKNFLYANYNTARDVFQVGPWWKERAVDVVVGDAIIVESSCMIEGDSIRKNKADDCIVECCAPGISKISTSKWATFVRVSKANFAGMYQYMHIGEGE